MKMYKKIFNENTAFINFLKKHFNDKQIIGVEIGVNKGDNALKMINALNIKELYCIDPYLETEVYGDADERKTEAFDKLIQHNTLVHFIYDRSVDAIKEIPDDVDFVFVDGEHTYPAVKSEIELYYPKIKPGGVIGFDDFSPRFVGVANAVIEFIFKNNLKLQTGKSTDCWIVKEGING